MTYFVQWIGQFLEIYDAKHQTSSILFLLCIAIDSLLTKNTTKSQTTKKLSK